MSDDKDGVSETAHYNKEKESVSATHKTKTERSSLIIPEENVVKLHHAALGISWVSVVFSLCTGCAAIVLGLTGDSEALFAYGLDAVLDSFSSVAVVWRFHGDADSVYSISRETKACIVIGFLFLVSAASLIGKSIYNIVTNIHESTQDYVLFVTFAVVCGVISVGLAVGKIYLGYKLNSRALATDSIITLVGAVSCFATVIGLILYIHYRSLWYLDSLFGIACGIFLFGFGSRLLYVMLFQLKQISD